MDFLDNIPSLPSLKQDYSNLISTVTGAEISDAIGSLHNGKAPGCDGLTAELYKSFEETLVLILVTMFEDIWKDKQLTLSQRMAIIILLYKKGDSRQLANYRPISLTNADYKVLAYVLSNRLSVHLTDVIAV